MCNKCKQCGTVAQDNGLFSEQGLERLMADIQRGMLRDMQLEKKNRNVRSLNLHRRRKNDVKLLEYKPV